MAASSSRLVVISLPLYRIARLTLSPVILGELRAHSDVAIVAPFAGAPGFQRDFGGPRTHFVQWTQAPLAPLRRSLLAASEIMRRNGYWRRFEHDGMAYYVANEAVEHGEDGDDRPMSFGRAMLFRILGWLGRARAAWRIVDRVLGARWARLPELESLASRYEHVTLVQSSSWGAQDRALATIARRLRWRSVMIPYTCDQLDVNGYLLNDYDAVCVQGPYELDRARRFHALENGRVVTLGSPWFRNLDRLRAEVAAADADARPTVIYGGTSHLYLPRSSELAAVDALHARIAHRREPMRFVYRPSGIWTADERRALESQYCARGIEIQWPARSAMGLEEYTEIDQEASLREFVASFIGCRLLVMSLTTSLAFDVAYLCRCGLVANFADPTGTLTRRRTQLFTPTGYAGISIAWSLDDLLRESERLLDDPDAARRQSDELIAQWDFPQADQRALLLRAVVGTAA